MRARSRWRYLAPVALVAVIVAMLLVIQAGLHTKHDTTASNSSSVTQASNRHGHAHRRFYIVKAGDSLSTISVKTGISIGTIEALNPRADPNALQTGERLRLRR